MKDFDAEVFDIS